MTEEEVKLATCQVLSEGESGTGWLISSGLVITAYHCVETVAKDGGAIKTRFGIGASAVELVATLGPHDIDLDVCLLQLPGPLSVAPIPIEVGALRPGENWSAFGFPAVKLELGHVLNGKVQQVLSERLHRVDLDLSVEQGTHLSDYKGLSGSALMVGAVCKGLVRLNVDSAIGAVSLAALTPFLRQNALLPEEDELTVQPPLGGRPTFDELFEFTILSKRGGYVFIDGSHGVGKSTYCKRFSPESTELDTLGVYPFTDRARGSTPAHQAQPEVFFDWVNSLLSSRSTGKPARLLELSYAQLIQDTDQVFQTLANRCSTSGKVGILFIDGINEAAATGEATLQRFVNLLPQTVPDGLVVVLTGVGLDAIASSLGGILQHAERLTLPTLDRDVQRGVCLEFLDEGKATTEIVATLCERALGHPLYLRYLADLVNSGANEGDIAALPVFSGAIEDYYETIWSQLIPSSDVVNLLAIIARLRWGISPSDLTAMLTPAESGAFTSTLVRIRHLLVTPENTEIYHPSFSEFVVHKTSTVNEWVQQRLAVFCGTSLSGDYGVLNRVFHGLKGGHALQLQAIQECQQGWVDSSVLLGAEPDVLLTDIEDTLTAATKIGNATDVVRLLLLSQRLSFRYNTLFVQSAELVAVALISLEKTEEALRHVTRSGHLLLRPDQAHVVAHALIQAGKDEEARGVLELAERAVNKAIERMWTKDGADAGDLLNALYLRLHGFSLAHAAGVNPPFTRLLRTVAEGILQHPKNNFSPEVGARIIRKLAGEMTGARLCLEGQYWPFSQLNIPADADLRHLLLVSLNTLTYAVMHSDYYHVPLKREMIDLLLADVAMAVDAELEPGDREIAYVDILIQVGAAPHIVQTYSAGLHLGDQNLPFYSKNRATPEPSLFDEAMTRLRATFFLEEGHQRPPVQEFSPYDWEETLNVLAHAIAWCDGKARKAASAKDQYTLNDVLSFIVEDLLPSFSFGLDSRQHWGSSYSIPEAIFPLLYGRLAKLLLDCYPKQVSILLDAIENSFGMQLGLYNEGFRSSLQEVLRLLVKNAPEGPHSDKAFALVLRWRDYVATNVQNRLEVVPELLQIIPLFARLGAAEEALKTYHLVLSYSMGPSWYKEDQLSIMSSTLEAIPATSPVAGASLANIAGLLERATGEMTFQRYVRADKGNFIGELCRRSLFVDAVKYFQHQACGTREQLLAQAIEGNLDRVSALAGMRFPGAALEEQAALLELLRHSRGKADWRLRWALLEVYQHGDSRHLTEWGREYAAIITELSAAGDTLSWAKTRVRTIAASLNNERALLLLGPLVNSLADELRPDFRFFRDTARASLEDYQVKKLTSSMGLRHDETGDEEPPVTTCQTEAESVADTTAKDSVDADDTDDGEHEAADPTESAFDRLYLPGTFGKQASIEDANNQLKTAHVQLGRRNFAAAKQACIAALRALQEGGWSVWTDNHSVSAADRLIGEHVQSADELVRLYGPLILDERHVQRWAIASHLVSLFGAKLDTAQQAELLDVAIDHIRQIVGEASHEPFSYVGASAAGDASSALFELLLWALDHPAWERRDSAASMVLWLVRTNDSWLVDLVPLAVSMDSRNRADVASASLDILSRENPVGLWQRIKPYVDLSRVVESCHHVSRLATFIRIAERASKCGDTSAGDALKALQAILREDNPSPRPVNKCVPPSYVPRTLFRLWQNLADLDVFTDSAMKAFAANLDVACAPIPVNTAAELERLVATGGRENAELSLGRWAATIRYCLNTALFYPMSASRLGKVEAALRTYNPESLREPEDGKALLTNLVAALESGAERGYKPSYGDLVYLDLQCYVAMARKAVHVELVAHLIPPGQPQGNVNTAYAFSSTELPTPGPDLPTSVSGRARPTAAYFGAVTPAIPTPQFLHLACGTPAGIVRYHWRDGSTVEAMDSSRRYEAALLAIRRDSLQLPSGWRLGWTLRVNGDLRAILSNA
jgi:Trypsin-like peptidase domain